MLSKSLVSAIAAGLLHITAAFAQSAGEGETLYRAACRGCHGADLNTSSPRRHLPSLVTYDFEQFERIVRDGRPGTIMPGFGSMFSEDQLCSLYLYVRSGRPGATPETRETCFPPPPEEVVVEEPDTPLFPAASGPTFQLRCQGGGGLRIRREVEAGARSRSPTKDQLNWKFEPQLNFSPTGNLIPGHCIWTGERPAGYPAPPGDGVYRFIYMSWISDDWRPYKFLVYHADLSQFGMDVAPRLHGPASPYTHIVSALSSDHYYIDFELEQLPDDPYYSEPLWQVVGATVLRR